MEVSLFRRIFDEVRSYETGKILENLKMTRVSRYCRVHGPIAQGLEQLAHNQLVPGSIPGGSTKLKIYQNH